MGFYGQTAQPGRPKSGKAVCRIVRNPSEYNGRAAKECGGRQVPTVATLLQAITPLLAIARDAARTVCQVEGGVLQTICLLLILVDTKSTVCPEKGRVSRTSYSKYNFVRQKMGFHGQVTSKYNLSGNKKPLYRFSFLSDSAAGRVAAFFRDQRHHQMPGRSWRAGQAQRRWKARRP